jgi:very-short-patch-repair endonuclease
MRVRTKTLTRARALRKAMTLPEVILWQALRRERFKGWRFRRQMPAGPYIADFGCLERKVIVEVDGAAHDAETVLAKDERRAAFLQEQGFEIFRIAAKDILKDLPGVLDGLAAFLAGKP